MRQQLGSVVSSAAAQRLLTLAEVRAELASADRGAALVVAPAAVVIRTKDAVSMRRVEQRAGL